MLFKTSSKFTNKIIKKHVLILEIVNLDEGIQDKITASNGTSDMSDMACSIFEFDISFALPILSYSKSNIVSILQSQIHFGSSPLLRLASARNNN